VLDEACLSIPGASGKVKRCAKVHVVGFDEQGHERSYEWGGIIGAAAQHEIDHLNGILFVDHLGDAKKQIEIRKHKKYMRTRHLPPHGIRV